jgi:hypothetical protein
MRRRYLRGDNKKEKKVVKKEEGICEEIKIALKEGIAEDLISTRTGCPKPIVVFRPMSYHVLSNVMGRC